MINTIMQQNLRQIHQNMNASTKWNSNKRNTRKLKTEQSFNKAVWYLEAVVHNLIFIKTNNKQGKVKETTRTIIIMYSKSKYICNQPNLCKVISPLKSTRPKDSSSREQPSCNIIQIIQTNQITSYRWPVSITQCISRKPKRKRRN